MWRRVFTYLLSLFRRRDTLEDSTMPATVRRENGEGGNKSDGRPWSDFVPLLGPAMGATYSLSGAQMPEFPPGVTFLSSKYLGEATTNCTMFTAYLCGVGFGGPFTLDQWNEWQDFRITDNEDKISELFALLDACGCGN